MLWLKLVMWCFISHPWIVWLWGFDQDKTMCIKRAHIYPANFSLNSYPVLDFQIQPSFKKHVHNFYPGQLCSKMHSSLWPLRVQTHNSTTHYPCTYMFVYVGWHLIWSVLVQWSNLIGDINVAAGFQERMDDGDVTVDHCQVERNL